MPAGMALVNRQLDGGSGTGPGPTPPQATAYSVVAHWSWHVAPVLGPHPGHSIAPLVVQPHPAPLGYVQETCARAALHVVRESFNDVGHEQAGIESLDGDELTVTLSPATSGLVDAPQWTVKNASVATFIPRITVCSMTRSRTKRNRSAYRVRRSAPGRSEEPNVDLPFTHSVTSPAASSRCHH